MPLSKPLNMLAKPLPDEWLLGTHLGSHRTAVRFLDTVAQVSPHACTLRA